MRQARYPVAGASLRLSVSIGVTASVGGHDSDEGMWRRADAALYAAKAGGRDRWHLASVRSGWARGARRERRALATDEPVEFGTPRTSGGSEPPAAASGSE